MRRTLQGFWLGRRRYAAVHELMLSLHERRQAGLIGDTVLLLEHEPVITLGRAAKAGHVMLSDDALGRRGIDLVQTGRGGDVTLHAPGQLVGYPIVDLNPDRRDVRRYVRDLTETMRRLSASWGVSAGLSNTYIGLWVDRARVHDYPGDDRALDPAKLGAIGVRISRWVTLHGFALNLTTDLELFQLIVPCGIVGRAVTSIAELTGLRPEAPEAASLAFESLADVLDADASTLLDVSRAPLDIERRFDPLPIGM
jgi:lipoyl(octanoyl) transferase